MSLIPVFACVIALVAIVGAAQVATVFLFLRTIASMAERLDQPVNVEKKVAFIRPVPKEEPMEDNAIPASPYQSIDELSEDEQLALMSGGEVNRG